MKVLILGSTGFIGNNLLKRLSKENLIVTTAERSSGIDLRSYEQMYNLINKNKLDIIFNLASHGGSVHYVKKNSGMVFYDNVQMALNLYRAISEININIKIIQPFSNCSYPGVSNIQKESEWLDGDVHPSVFSFGNSKRSIFYLSECFKQQYGIRSVNILFPNTYGPGDSLDPNHTHALNGMVIRMLQSQSKQENQFVVWGTGTPIREWAYIDDFVEILFQAIEIDGQEYPINMGQNKGYSIAESAMLIKRACKFNGDIIFDTSYKDGDPVKILSGEKFNEQFAGFSFYDHYQGILNTVKYYKEKI
jgi:GDP-L-fucose synthase